MSDKKDLLTQLGASRLADLLLEDLKSAAQNPESGVRMVAELFEADEKVFHSCDDSDGLIGDVFRFDAADLFSRYARDCQDKAGLSEIVAQLSQDDNYGVRDSIIQRASEFLPEHELKSLADRFWSISQEDPEHASHWLHLVESLARQSGARLSITNPTGLVFCRHPGVNSARKSFAHNTLSRRDLLLGNPPRPRPVGRKPPRTETGSPHKPSGLNFLSISADNERGTGG